MKTKAIVVPIGVLALLLGLFVFRDTAIIGYEFASYRLMPSAARAFEYGEKHFNSRNTNMYNIKVAEYFLWEAEKLDSNLPYVYHEIARVEFLRGRLDTALIFINSQIEKHGDQVPNSYYVRGLIQGYRGDYAAAAEDYEKYLRHDANNWAAINDYAWVLLKADRPSDAKVATARGLSLFPQNAWLLNTHAIALYELGEEEGALASVEAAARAVEAITEAEWLIAYPGNDPKVASEGIATLKDSIAGNMHTIEAASVAGAVQSK